MSWKAVDLGTPKAGEYLCIVKFWITIGTDHLHGYGREMTSSVDMVISCGFDPKKGWSNILFKNIEFEVLYWMLLPPAPEECIPLSKIFPQEAT